MLLQTLLDLSLRDHNHLCPRQILGVRLGIAGLQVLGFEPRPAGKRVLVIVETDGCFTDGVSAATDCTVGHRTLRVEDYGKAAAVFVDTTTEQAVRVVPAPGIRERAYAYAPGETRHYFAQLQAYQTMPAEEMFSIWPVTLTRPIRELVSRPGVRVNCDMCGEEIINEREVRRGSLTLCRACALGPYYQPRLDMPRVVAVCQSE